MSKRHKVLSFDVFDTLVTRCVANPVNVFSCVDRKVRIQGLQISDFVSRRLNAEKKAIETYGAEQLTLDQIYSNMEDLDVNTRNILKDIEAQAEIDLAMPLCAGVSLFRRAIATGAPVVLVSDMYLPGDVIKRILSHCGIAGYDRLYVSSEYGKSKVTGKLFQQVLADYRINADELRHCGDSLVGDYKVPKKMGIDARLSVNGKVISEIHADLNRVKRKVIRDKGFSIQRVAQLNNFQNDLQRVGFETLGPFLYGFVRWIRAQRVDLGLDSLLFLSRDGYLMKKAYDIVYPDEQSEYVYASRRAWTVPLYHKRPELDFIIEHAGFGRDISIDEFMTRVGISEDQKPALLANSGFSISDRITVASMLNNAAFLSFFESTKDAIVENSRKEYDACLNYLSEVIPTAKVGLVDIGWRGSMQHALNELLKILDRKVDVTGLYIGVDQNSRWRGQQKMLGYMFDGNRRHEVQDRETLYNSLLEALFVAPHGSLSHYETTSNGVRPVFQKAEDGLEDGSCPLFRLQEGALAFISEVVDNKWDQYLDLSRIGFGESLERLGLAPTYAEATLIGDIEFAYQDYKALAKPCKKAYYLSHPKALRDDFLTCYWKPAFLKRFVRYIPGTTSLLLFAKHHFAA